MPNYYKFIQYLRSEGIGGLVSKVVRILKRKLFGSEGTIFLKADSSIISIPVRENTNVRIEFLNVENCDDFERIKFFAHVHVSDYLAHPQRIVALVRECNEYIGYACADFSSPHTIHGLGDFRLDTGEAWIGPVFVKKQWRGKGLNPLMVAKLLNKLREAGIHTIYTCISGDNAASLGSFRKMGFKEWGRLGSESEMLNPLWKKLTSTAASS
ncbi:MAG: GNAT family N-acetyltransferase [Bacteroidaceae bacterium]|nr:GNAT family N-acetyltransferase [Bacteroidaceae bacterium]